MSELIIANWQQYLVGANSDYFKNQLFFKFPNGFGASIIHDLISYGHIEGLFELAVIYWSSDGKHHLTYDTPITDDVLGSLTSDEVASILRQIMMLPDAHKSLKG